MKIEYITNVGFIINGKEFNWEDERIDARKKLNNQHTENDIFFENSIFFDGDKSYDIYQKRDVYQNMNNEKNHFFLNYDREEKLESLEVHSGITISVNDIELVFKKDINDYLKLLKSIGQDYMEIEDGNFLFQNLKVTIANSKSMGGKGKGLSYFYASKNIDHLIEE